MAPCAASWAHIFSCRASRSASEYWPSAMPRWLVSTTARKPAALNKRIQETTSGSSRNSSQRRIYSPTGGAALMTPSRSRMRLFVGQCLVEGLGQRLSLRLSGAAGVSHLDAARLQVGVHVHLLLHRHPVIHQPHLEGKAADGRGHIAPNLLEGGNLAPVVPDARLHHERENRAGGSLIEQHARARVGEIAACLEGLSQRQGLFFGGGSRVADLVLGADDDLGPPNHLHVDRACDHSQPHETRENGEPGGG